jgi:hypothetical protein
VERSINHNSIDLETDVEKTINHDSNRPNSIVSKLSYNTTTRPFIGRLGGNQEFVIDRHNAANAEILREQPDSAPCMTLREQFDLGGFRNLGLWKAAVIEGVGKYSTHTLHPASSGQTLINNSSRRYDAHLHHNLDQPLPIHNPCPSDCPVRAF